VILALPAAIGRGYRPRTLVLLAAVALLLPGCLSLPPPPVATARSEVGDVAPVFTLARTGPTPGVVTLSDLTGKTAAVLVFYRGHW
jgi:hypothetical protein